MIALKETKRMCREGKYHKMLSFRWVVGKTSVKRCCVRTSREGMPG